MFEFNDKIAAEVMTHRKDVALLWLDQSDEQWADIISTTSRHSLYPVCDQSSDNVLGILNTKNYFRLDDRSRDNVMEKAVRSAYFVPETVRADVLFRNMQKSRDHFAVVLDEYGGMQGIITMNDLLEEIVGELEDDSSIPVDPPLIEKIDAKSFKVQGHAPLYMVSKRVGVLLPEDEYDTFGGMVFGLLGYVPKDGSTPELESFGPFDQGHRYSYSPIERGHRIPENETARRCTAKLTAIVRQCNKGEENACAAGILWNRERA